MGVCAKLKTTLSADFEVGDITKVKKMTAAAYAPSRRRTKCVIAATLVWLLLVPVFSWAFKVTMSAKFDGEDKPLVIGATNLPEGTELMVTVQRTESGYMAQGKTRVVNGGTFRAGPFSQKGAPLNPGTYAVSVSSTIASLQPSSVRSVMGQGGSNLEGPLVKPALAGNQVVEWEGALKLGSGQVLPEKDRAGRAEAAKEKHEWRVESCKDICNLEQRARRGDASFKWGQCHTKCLANFEQRK